tara:strand:- start:125738 stop:127411 length:1674 start_codon:yes stop_codon:yes gene_type:complete
MSHFTPKLWTFIKNGYSKELLRADGIAGLTVAIIALPLAMAIAIASGTSPEKGLITAVIGGFFISTFGGSRFQIGGPTGAFIVVVYNVILNHGYDGLILATLIAGFILLIAGYSKLGQVIKYVPYCVITGFTAGIAVIIASSQVKDFLGLHLEEAPVNFILRWQAYFMSWDTLNISAFFVGIAALLVIIVLKKFKPKMPGYLIAIIICSLLVSLFQIPVETIGTTFPEMSTGLSMPPLPVWNFEKILSIIPSAFTIAFLAGIESLLSAVVADGMVGTKHRPNQELVGQGVANIASSLFGGIPVTGAIARTATNIKAGGKTPMAGIFHAFFVLLFVLFAINVMAYIPMAALAAILFVVAWSMSEVHHFTHILRLPSSSRIVMLLTFFLTIFVDLTVAIGVGVTFASLLFMKNMTQLVDIKSEGRRGENTSESQLSGDSLGNDALLDDVEVFRIMGPLFFGVAGDFLDMLKSIGEDPKVFILRLRLVPYLDATGTLAIENIVKHCHEKNIFVILSGVQEQPKKMLEKTGVIITSNQVFYSPNYKASLKLAKNLMTKDYN